MALRKCKKCGRFGHFAKTCKNATRVVTREVPIQSMGAAMGVGSIETEFTPIEQAEPVIGGGSIDGTIGEAVAAEEFREDLNPIEESQVYEGQVVEREPAREAKSAEPAGPTPAEVMFNRSMNTLFTFWGGALDAYAEAKVSPPEEIKDLCCMAWTDAARAMGWLEHADDPRIAALLAVGITGGTYGVATYGVIQAKRKKGRG